jgi:RHS repeat-associated protein
MPGSCLGNDGKGNAQLPHPARHGAVVNQIDYDSYGNIVGQTNPSVTFRFGYTGREWDGETGQYYYRARYYDPTVGQFISQDPIGFAAGDANLYRYVGNSPTNFTDPSGLFSEISLPNPIDVVPILIALSPIGIAVITAESLRPIVTTPAPPSPLPTPTPAPVPSVPDHTGHPRQNPADFDPNRRGTPSTPNVPSHTGSPRQVDPSIGLTPGASCPAPWLVLPSTGGSGDNDKIQGIINDIRDNNLPVQINRRNPATSQEGNITVGLENGKRVNIRVETHPLNPGGEPIRHANIEVIKTTPRGKNRVQENIHITK